MESHEDPAKITKSAKTKSELHTGGGLPTRVLAQGHIGSEEGWGPAGWGSHATCEPFPHATCGRCRQIGRKSGGPCLVLVSPSLPPCAAQGGSCLHSSPWEHHSRSFWRRQLSYLRRVGGHCASAPPAAATAAPPSASSQSRAPSRRRAHPGRPGPAAGPASVLAAAASPRIAWP
jgi:hypothetical protein